MNDARRASAVDAAESGLKVALALVGTALFGVLDFGFGLGRRFHGTPKQQAFAVVLLIAVPLFAAYWPLRWVLVRSILRASE